MNGRPDEFKRGLAFGALLFLLLAALLILAGDLSASKFIYVDF